MESLINRFLAVSSDGYGYGYGNGNGNGNGNGSGDGYGNGSVYGNSNGNGDGDGRGYGNGNGDGYGYGYCDGYGYGYGDGRGYGNGDGDGDGDGRGDGDGDEKVIKNYCKGHVTDKKAKLAKFKSKDVYYIDDIPCIFYSIKGDLAKIKTININKNFALSDYFVFKYKNVFAHGMTAKQAKKEAIEIYKNKYKNYKSNLK
jgi:hypothetical protein